MNFLSILFPQTIYTTKSKFSGEIKVIDHVGERRMSIGGLTQSGGVLTGMWNAALRQLRTKDKERRTKARHSGLSRIKELWVLDAPLVYQDDSIKNVLILGLGAGTAAELVAKYWPHAEIDGVEIDEKVIEIGKKYFKLENIKNLQLINDDAIAYVQHATRHTRTYDLILVDLYNGYVIEKRLQNEIFLRNLHRILSKNGFVICNVLTVQKTHFEANKFLDKLDHIFQYNFNRKILTNTFVFSTKNK